MRLPDLIEDGWCLEDGEELHREAPMTFLIPDLKVRQILQPGDFAKLIFKIALEEGDEPEAFERRWVVVRERTPWGYLGVLDNQPSAIAENDALWIGSELPFEPRHIIAVDHGTDESAVVAHRPSPIPWPHR
jgi:hypothetical protein